jgi:GST-like protein
MVRQSKLAAIKITCCVNSLCVLLLFRATVNRPTAGPRTEKELPVGKHPLQLYSMATPNGQKVTIMLEELLEMGIKEAEYDAWLIEIGKQDQFSSGFCKVNPNSKIPAMMDYSNKEKPVRVFESGAILLYLSDKFGNSFVPMEHRQEVLNWLFWQMGAAP